MISWLDRDLHSSPIAKLVHQLVWVNRVINEDEIPQWKVALWIMKNGVIVNLFLLFLLLLSLTGG
jgi:hypothetical protein